MPVGTLLRRLGRIAVLLVEDSPDDAELTIAALRTAGLNSVVTVVDNEAAFVAALADVPDVIISDLELPGFDGRRALALRAELAAETPFIVMSGAMTDGEASDLINRGATDYLLKDRRGRLVSAVLHSVDAHRTLKARWVAERMFVEHMRDGAATLSSRGFVLYANDSLARLLSCSRDELVGSPFADVVVGEFPTELSQTSLTSDDGATVEVELRGRDGHPIPVLISVSRLDVDGDRLACVTVTDLRGQKSLEEQLRQAQRMEAIGSLAGGVAHDFNNMLTVILGYCSVLSVSATDEVSRGAAARIDETAERAKGLTTQLLAFSRQQVLRPEVTDANAVVASVMRMLEVLLGESIVIEIQPDSELQTILIDPGQLGQVILNLAVNARDAMPEGGRLSIRTRNVILDDADVAIDREMIPGRYVLLEVSDTGTGMGEPTRSRAFDPFFTTKSGGTGLGLSTVYGIVKQSHGLASLESDPGVGTTFRLYFPAFTERRLSSRTQPDAAASAHEDIGPSVGGVILLVDDEESIRTLVASHLESKGYTVLTAGGGEEALAIATDEETPVIDLLLTDIAMPGMSGSELGIALAAVRPEIRILYTSGYPSNIVGGQGTDPASFIQKPYRLDALVQRINETLGRPPLQAA